MFPKRRRKNSNLFQNFETKKSKEWVRNYFNRGKICLLLEKIPKEEDKTVFFEKVFPCKILSLSLGPPINLWLCSLEDYPNDNPGLVDQVYTSKGKTILSISFRSIESLIRYILPVEFTLHLTENLEEYSDIFNNDVFDLTKAATENSYNRKILYRKQCHVNCIDKNFEHLLNFCHVLH